MVKKAILALLFLLVIAALLTTRYKTEDPRNDIELLATVMETEESETAIVTSTEVPLSQDLESTSSSHLTPTIVTTVIETPPPSTVLDQSLTTIVTEAETDILYLYNELEVPDVKDFKSWTNFRSSVNRNSGQWRILMSEGTWTDSNGFRRKNDDYMVAMGSYYTHALGDRFKITTDNGNEFTVTICDWKNDKHTDAKHQYSVGTGCIVEFYVDDNLVSSVRRSGTASSIPELSGKITKIERIR